MNNIAVFYLFFIFSLFGLILGDQCSNELAKLKSQRTLVCSSLRSTNNFCTNETVKASHGFPTQSVYFHDMLNLVANSNPLCLKLPYGKNTVEVLNKYIGNPHVRSSFLYQWVVFQPGYYEMPRKHGERIESPYTLGLKCWAFAYLKQLWEPKHLSNTVSQAGLSLDQLIDNYNNAIPLTMTLCEKVMANCFVNATYNPARKGTCPFKIDEFYAGFEYSNLLHGLQIKWPF